MLTPEEKKFFSKRDKLWEKTPKNLKAFAVWIAWVFGFVVLSFGIYGFIVRFDLVDFTKDYNVSYKCPTDYDTKEEYVESVVRHAKSISEKNPGITEEELLQKREDWFISMKCEKSPWAIIQNY